MKRFLYSILGFLLIASSKAQSVLAIGINDFREGTYKPINIPGIRSSALGAEGKISIFIRFFIDLILYASGGLAVLMLIIGAIQYIISFGKSEAQEKATKTITHALLGLLAVIMAYFVVTNIIQILYATAG